jgi:hypothetical protein
MSGDSVQADVFESKNGGFSIAIPQMPSKTINRGTDKAKAKGIDTGKQFVWLFERTLYTAFYSPPIDNDGNPSPPAYADMESGTRKGVLRQNAKLISEEPIKLGEYRGTEFRYVSAEGVHYISRIYLVGDMGYQIVGGYADDKDEKKVLEVLDSFKLLRGRPEETLLPTSTSANAETGPGELRLNRLGKLADLVTKGELEPRTKRFRMNIPFLKSRYSPPTPVKPNLLQYQWDFVDAVVVLSVVTVQPGNFTNMSVASRKQTLEDFLVRSMTEVGGQKISESDVSADSVVGKEFKVRRVKDTVIARAFIAGDMYISVSAAVESADAEVQVKKLFDSLEFLK